MPVPEGIDGTKALYAVAEADIDYRAGNLDQALVGSISALEYDDDNADALYKVGLIQNLTAKRKSRVACPRAG